MDISESQVSETLPFESFSMLALEHSRLLEQLSTADVDEVPEGMVPEIEEFIGRSAAMGFCLSNAKDRANVQAALTYWASVLQSARRSPQKTVLEHFDPSRLIKESTLRDPYKGLLA